MKLIIDISKDRYDEIMSMDWKNCRLLFDEEIRAIHDGKVLEKEPCADCISREATVERLCKIAEIMNEKREGLGSPYVMAALFIQDNKDEFPSVTPQPKIGRWIRWNEEKENYWYIREIQHCKCSECGNECDPHISRFIEYCPNCGAKMQEVEND